MEWGQDVLVAFNTGVGNESDHCGNFRTAQGFLKLNFGSVRYLNSCLFCNKTEL